MYFQWPVMKEGTKKWKDLLMVAITADGSCIPPVIMTDDKQCPKIYFDEGKVIRVSSSQAPSQDNVKRWINVSKEYLTEGTYLFMDDHKAHSNVNILADLPDGIIVEIIPPGTGKVLDPVDNSFNSVIENYYYQQQRSTHFEMLQAIHAAYYQPTNAIIQRYFSNIGYISNEPVSKVVNRLATHGLSTGAISSTDQAKWISLFESWKHS